MSAKCAIILVRVSTSYQDYDPQIMDLIDYAKQKGYTKIHKIGTTESGLADMKDRIGLDSLYSFFNDNPEYNTIFATEMTRLSRRQVILHEIKEWLIKNRIQLFLKDTGYSLLNENGMVTHEGEIMFSLYGYFAESEMKQKKERFARNRKFLMEKGISISGKTLFGYEKKPLETDAKKNTLVKHPVNHLIVKDIFNWYANGFDSNDLNPSIKSIAIKCIKDGKPKYTHSKRNINKLLKEQAYTGEKITNNKRKNPNYYNDQREEKYIITSNLIRYPKIIDKETFETVQQKLKTNNTQADKSSKHITILSRLIKCNSCGNHLTADYRFSNGKFKHSYRCSSRTKVSPCQNKQTIGMIMIDSLVWCLIKTDLKKLAKSINKLNPDINYNSLLNQQKKIETRISEIDRESTALQKSIRIKTSSIEIETLLADFNIKILKLDKEKSLLLKEISSIKANMQLRHEQNNDVYKVITSNLKSIEESRELLKKYISYFVQEIRIILHNNKYSALLVVFKNFENQSMRDIAMEKKSIANDEYIKHTYILVDKIETLKIKAIKSIMPLKFKENDIVVIEGKKLQIDKLFELFKTKDKPNKSQFDFIKEFKFDKLKAY